MKRADWLIVLQGISAGVQVANMMVAALSHPPIALAICIAAAATTLSIIAQRLGNQNLPPAAQAIVEHVAEHGSCDSPHVIAQARALSKETK